MQIQQLYVTADTSVGQLRDVSGTKTMTPPELIYGVDTMLALTFLQQAGRPDVIDLTEAAKSVVSWQFLMAQDFREETPILIATTGDLIYVENNTVYVPINTRTVEAADWLGSSESKSGLYGELNGYDTDGNPVFYSLIKNFSLRQRIASSGTPEEMAAEYLTAEQVRALIASGAVLQFSENGNSWHETQTDSDIYIRFRSASSSTALWSTAIRLPAGIQGIQGEKGEKGDTGAAFRIDATGPLADLALYDDEAENFGFLDLDSGNVYLKLSAASADWSEPIPFRGPQGLQGEKGEKGDIGATGATGADGTSAGFGTPMAYAYSMPAGTSPSVTVSASGSNTSKVFTFNFYIPQGEKGEKGDKGDSGGGSVDVQFCTVTAVDTTAKTATVTGADGMSYTLNYDKAGA